MTTARQLLDNKGRDVWSIDESATVYAAVALMSHKNVGALIVSGEATQIAGIISERDYTRKIILMNRASKETRVREIMTREVIVVPEETVLNQCMALMLQHQVRHLPVVKAGRAVGMITLGDIMKTIIDEQSATIHQLEDFIFEEQGGEG